jgi:hypothetical protein
VVQHGDKLGRTIGFPTANLPLGSYLRPRYGIYAVTGRMPDGRVVQGAANIGIRPTFDPPKELLEPISSTGPAISMGRRSRWPSTTSCGPAKFDRSMRWSNR